jgi:hypothetical protein
LHSDTSGLPIQPREQKNRTAAALALHFSRGVALELAQAVNPLKKPEIRKHIRKRTVEVKLYLFKNKSIFVQRK